MIFSKKTLSLLLAILMLAAFTASAMAEEAPLLITPIRIDTGEGAEAEHPIFERWQKHSGEITGITPIEVYEDGTIYYHVAIKAQQEGTVVFVITPGSIGISGDEYKIGDTFTAWYDGFRPVIMIYPPQYEAVVYGVNLGITGVKITRFDEDFLSREGDLVIRIGEDTVIRWADGAEFTGEIQELIGPELVIVHSILALSFPAQTTPSAIYILPELEENDGAWGDDGGLADLYDFTDIPILVNGEQIEVPFPPYAVGWMVMVPLRAVAEALGFEVHWVANDQPIMLNNVYSVQIGVDSYIRGRMVPFQLGIAPELVNSTTFVPLSFFRDVIGLNNAYFFEGVIEINDDEPMESDMH